jgi:predicted Zn-dependent peptidase
MLQTKPEIFKLRNGIRVVYSKKEAFVAHLGVMIHAGSRFERKHEEGLAHFIEHSIFKGTDKREALDVFSDLDSVGGELNAYTNKEEICLHASFRKNHFDIASELLGDIVENASFPEEEIEVERSVVLDEIISYLDTPSERIFDDFEEAVFRGCPLGRNILGTKESVSSFTRNILMEYKKNWFTADNIVISFVGDLDQSELADKLEIEFGGIESGEKQRDVISPPGLEKFKLSRNHANFQAHTLIGGLAPSYNSEDRKAMALLVNLLGGPALNSRLNLNVREKHGYSYNIEAGFTSYSDTGMWNIYLGTDMKYLSQANELVYSELRKLVDSPLEKNELEGAKEQLKGHLALSYDSNLELMISNAKNLLMFNKVDTLDDIYISIDELKVDEVKAVSAKWFNESNIGELIYTTGDN